MIIDEHISSENLSPAYLFFGDEAYLRRQYTKKLIAALVREGDNMNLSKFEGDKCSLEDIILQASTAPFFAKHRVVLVENSGLFEKAGAESLTEYLNNPCPSTVLIFSETKAVKNIKQYKAIDKNGCVLACETPSEPDLKRWIAKELKANHMTIDRDAWDEFLSRTYPTIHGGKWANDHRRNKSTMDTMASELEKLLSYMGERSSITKADVEAICTRQLESEIFNLVDAMRNRNATLVFKLYQSLLEDRTEPLQILYLLMQQFNSFYLVKDLSSQGLDIRSIVQKTKMNEYILKKNLEQARNFSKEEIRSFLQEALDLEHRFKSGRIEASLAVELLVVGLASRS